MLSNRRGIALVTTLWILAALVMLAIGFGFLARTEAQVAYNFSSLLQCRWAARAGINRALIEVERLKSQPTTYLGEGGKVLTSEEDDVDLGDASYEVVIEDEAGRININASPRVVLENLFGDRDYADCIMDWRDTNDEPRPLGAETQYYSLLDEPYRCKNKPFDTVRELLLVKEISEEMLESEVGAEGRTLADLLTVYSHDENKTVEGEDRINIQSATKEQLQQKFTGTLTEQEVDAIIRYRGRRAFQRAGDVIRVRDLSRDKVSQIYDRLTVRDSASSEIVIGDPFQPSGNNAIAGLVNINTASAEVLAALPGMDQGIAQAIVDHRQSAGPFEDVGSVLDVAALTDDAFARSGDYMTVRSRVFRITATGRLKLSQVLGTVVCVVDTSGDKTEIKYWRE